MERSMKTSHRRARRSTWLLATAVAMTAASISGCTVMGDQQASPPTTTTSSDPSAQDAPAVDAARLLGQQYDYDGALRLVEPLKSDAAKQLTAVLTNEKAALQIWPDNSTVSHLFFHSLIVDPDRAFDGDEDTAGYDDYMVTLTEFTSILESLYSRGYVLVSPHDLAAPDAAGQLQYQPLALPAGKTPLVLSQDDVNYYDYEIGDGFATNLTLQRGRVVNTYEDAQGTTRFGAYDVAPLVDDFVSAHPDFSFKGHKGLLGVTGYEGVLGYRTSPSENQSNPARIDDQKRATEVADALKAEGWEFASHSWGHIGYTNASLDRITRDEATWAAEVRPIVGPTDLFIYPFGADIAGVGFYSGAKFDSLHQEGFLFFFGVDGSTSHWQQLHPDYLRQARVNIDGIRLREALNGHGTVLEPFFDTNTIFDTKRPST
jgi:hypothetical protein